MTSQSGSIKILSILGQKPLLTGSGVVIKELWDCGMRCQDSQWAILAGYPGDDYSEYFDNNYSMVTYSHRENIGELPFPIFGMSDAMPYPTIRYSDANMSMVELHIEAFRMRMMESIAEFKPDIIHIHHLWVLVALAKNCRDIPCFVTAHGTDLKQLQLISAYRKFISEGLPQIYHIFCVSKAILYQVCENFDLTESKVSVIGNGFNEAIFFPDGPPAQNERIKPHDFVIVCAGKYSKWKGFRYLIRACGKLPFAYRLVVLGDGPEDEKRTLEDETIEQNISDKTLLLGHLRQTEVAKWYRRANVFVLSSTFESFGLVFLEAMACGCPVIVSALGGPQAVFSSPQARYLIDSSLATLVSPLNEEKPSDALRFVTDICDAIKKIYPRKLTLQDRAMIAESVKGWEWKRLYETQRRKYLEAIQQR